MSIRKQGPWGLWWLCAITFGVYYCIWYQRINDEMSAVIGVKNPGNGQWWSQLVPFYGFYALAKTAQRVNAAHAATGSSTRVGTFTTWFWAPSWFGSQTRYLQRRINVLADVQQALAISTAAQPMPALPQAPLV